MSNYSGQDGNHIYNDELFAGEKAVKQSRLINIVLPIIVILIFVGFLGVRAIQKSINNPEKIFAEALENNQALTSAKIEGSFTAFPSGNDPTTDILSFIFGANVNVDFVYSFDVVDPNKQELSLDADLNSLGGKITTVSLLTENGEDIFFRVGDIEKGLLTGVESYLNKWILVTPDMITELSEGEVDVSVDSEEVLKVASEITKNYPFYPTKELAEREIDGHPMYRYSVSLNEGKRDRYIEAMSQGNPELEKVFENVEFKDGEIWIGKRDKYIHKAKFSFDIPSASPDTPSFSVDLNLDIKNFNNASLPKAPVDYYDIDKIVNLSSEPKYAKLRDDQKRIDLTNILDGVALYEVSSGEEYPAPVVRTCIGTALPCFDISNLVPLYLQRVPLVEGQEPTNTGYYIHKDETSTVIEVESELEGTIEGRISG